MTYTVVWKPSAEETLAEAWLRSGDPDRITFAANEIDRRLRSNPQDQGESRSGSVRVLIAQPLVVAFEVHEQDRRVTVLALRVLDQ